MTMTVSTHDEYWAPAQLAVADGKHVHPLLGTSNGGYPLRAENDNASDEGRVAFI